MNDDKIPYEDLREKLARAESTLDALRRGEVDIVVGSTEPLVVRFKPLVDEKERLRTLLNIVRRIDQLIIHEDEPQRLLQSAADCLSEGKLFLATRIVQMDKSGKTVLSVESGNGSLCGTIGDSESPSEFPCLTKIGESSGPMVIAEPIPACDECTEEGFRGDRCLIGVPLHHAGEVFGALMISAPRSMAEEADAHKLCGEIGGDLGFALFRIHQQAAHKKTERERKHLMMAVEQAGEIVLVADPDGTIQYVNPAFTAVTGYSREEVVGQNPRLLKSGKQDRAFYRDLWETITSGRTWKGRMVNKRKDGTFYTEASTISPVRDVSGNIVNFVAVKRDISENIRIQKEKGALQGQLMQAQKMESIGVLAGGVAHDFNNLLTTILGCAELALAELGKEEPIYEDITEIKKAGERAARLTSQLLAFSRKEIREPELLDLNGTLEEMEKMLRRLIREDIELVVIPEPGLRQVYLDPSQMDQIIMNLVVNARDAMPDGGTLTLETANVKLDRVYFRNHGIDNDPGPYVMLAVTDTGIGMDQDVQTKMFDPFFTTKDRGTGTGLGLATLYGIIKQNKGYLWSYSEPGQGTTMKVYLPKAKEILETGDREEAHEGGLTGAETVLVAEDNDPVRDVTLKILDQFGYRTLEARDGEEAVRVSRDFEGEIHLLLTDVIMPGMSGKELSERLQSMRPDMKVLYMSGYTENIIMQKGLLPADIHYIQKPFSLKGLASKVKETIQMQSG